jgi:hypothetical protein
MPNFTFAAFLNLLAALFLSVGGATIVIIALSKWFGEFISQRLLDRYNNKHEEELELLKGSYQKEIEITKMELEKAKSLFIRYSEKQFELYNHLWKVLLYTKNQADALWEEATPAKIPSFSEQIRLTKNAIDDNMLLIEEKHYKQIHELIARFEQFSFGKSKLIDLSNKDAKEMENITQEETRRTIEENRAVKQEYDQLLIQIGKSFRSQIKG